MVICTLPSKTLRRLPPFAYSQEVIISHWFGMERRGRGEEEEPTLVVRLSSQHSISLQHAKTRPFTQTRALHFLAAMSLPVTFLVSG